MSLSRRNFGFLGWPQGRRFVRPLWYWDAPDKGLADETRHDQHRILCEAKLQIPLVPETFEPLCCAVVPQRPQGPGQITFDDALRPPVQFRAYGPQPVEDGPRRGFVLGGAAALPATPDHHDLRAVVDPGGQILCQGASVYEGSGQDGPRPTRGLHDAGPIGGREGDRGVRGHFRIKDLGG